MRASHTALLAFICGAAFATPPTSDRVYEGDHYHGPPHGHGHGPPDVVTKTIINTSTIWMTSQICPSNKMNCPDDEKMLKSSCVTKTTTVLASTTVQVPVTPTSALPAPAPPSSSRVITNEAIVETTSKLPTASSTKKTGPLPLTRNASGACYFGEGRTNCPHVGQPANTPVGIVAASMNSVGSAVAIPIGATTDTRVPSVADLSTARSSASPLTAGPGSSVQNLGAGVGVGNPAGQSAAASASIIGLPPISSSGAAVQSSNMPAPVTQSTFPRPSVGVAPGSAAAGGSSTPVAASSSVNGGQIASSSGRRTLDVIGSLIGVAPGNTVIGGTTTTVAGGLSVINGATVPITAGNTPVSVVPLVGVGPGSIVSGGQTVAVPGGSSVIGGTTMLAPAGNNSASAVPLLGVAPGSTVVGGTTIAVAGGSSVISGSTIPVLAASTPIPPPSIAPGSSAPRPSTPSGSASAVASSGLAASSIASRASASRLGASAGTESAAASSGAVASSNDLSSSRDVQSASSAVRSNPGASSNIGSSSRPSVPAVVPSDASSRPSLGTTSSSRFSPQQSGSASSAPRPASSGPSGSSSSPLSPSMPPSTGAVPSSPIASRTSSTPSRPASAAASSTSLTASSTSSSMSVTLISSSSAGNVSMEWNTLLMPLNFWDTPGQQVIGCPNNEPCCVRLPPVKLTTSHIITYPPISTWVWSLEGDSEYKSAGVWELPKAAGGDMDVCSFEGKFNVKRKPTVLTIPAKTITGYTFSPMCNGEQDDLGPRTVDPCSNALKLPPRITAVLQAREVWQQPMPFAKDGAKDADPAKVTYAACNTTKWIVQPQPTDKVTCSLAPITVSQTQPSSVCQAGSSGCLNWGKDGSEEGGSEGGDDHDDDIDIVALFGKCWLTGPFSFIVNFFANLKCTCGIFGCDGGCGPKGCGSICGILQKVPFVGAALSPIICKSRCVGCGFGGGVGWPQTPPKPKPRTTPNPSSPQTSPPNSKPTTSNSRSSSKSSCSERTAIETSFSCFTGTASSTCSEVGRSTITGCTVQDRATTAHCSMSTGTKMTIFCASSGTSGSCISPTATSSTVVSGCELSATTATSFGPSCPMMTELPPIEGIDNNGIDPFTVPTTGGPDPVCEDDKTTEASVAFETILKPQIDDFCDYPGTGMRLPGAMDLSTASEPRDFFQWEHHCISSDDKTVLVLVVASTPDCVDTKFDKSDCQKQFGKIADKCAAPKNKNDRIGGQIYDQKCFGYTYLTLEHLNGPKPPRCILGQPKPDGPPPNADNADAWQFMFGIQWNQADYANNAQDKVEVAMYGGAANVDLNTCDNYWSQNEDAQKPGFGSSMRDFDLGTKVQVTGHVKDLVEDPNIAEKALPFDIRLSPTGGIQGTGIWPRDGSNLNLNGSCVQGCVMQRDKDRTNELYTRCKRPKNECDRIKAHGAFPPGTLMIDYRCEKVDRKKTSCQIPNGKQRNSEVGANTFMPLFLCKMSNSGSGPKNINPPPKSSSTTGPKTLATPVKGKDSFKELNFAMVYRYTMGDAEKDNRLGWGMLFSYKHNERKLDCPFFDEKPEGGGYGYVQAPLDDLHGEGWEKGDKLGAYVKGSNGVPQPKPERLPLSNGNPLVYPGNQCATKCEMTRSPIKQSGGNGPFMWWVKCSKPNKDCAEQPPTGNEFYGFVCKDVKAEKLECGSNKRNIFVPVMVCTPDDKESGWRTSTMLDTPRQFDVPKIEPTEPVKEQKDSFKEIDFALVYKYTQAKVDLNEGAGDIQLYAYKRDNFHLTCPLFERQPGGIAKIEQPLDTTMNAWPKGNRLRDYVNGANGVPQPIPDVLPWGKRPDLSWGSNKCAKKCFFSRDAVTDLQWWVVCGPPDTGCADQAPAKDRAKSAFRFRCRSVEGKKTGCGPNKKDFYVPSLVCSGDDKESGWHVSDTVIGDQVQFGTDTRGVQPI